MAADENDKVELPALEQLQSLGWGYIHGAELTPETLERSSCREPVLATRLTSAIKRINPWINEENLRKVVRDLIQIPAATLMEANQSIWETLTQYISVEQDVGHGRRGQTVKIIDFENPDNNEFLCVNQFKVEGVHQNIYPDIVLFVNGLPLAVIECKSPYIANPMSAGIDQLLRYANRRQPHEDEGAERLFHYNQVMVSTHRESAKVATISAKMEHYLEWKDPYPLTGEDLGESPSSQELLIAGLFSKQNFLDLIQNFTVFEPDGGRVIKKLARYQQFRAVHKTIERLKTGTTRKERGGVIWHTQGSGKSLTMVFLAMKMRRDEDLREYKLVFLTDRTQLDGQLTATFKRAQNETVYHAKSVAHLKELLAKDSSDLVTAMVQKFQENADDFDFQELNASDKIIVLADEAHRTQYGTLGAAINTALPNAPKIAFTGTPLIKSRKTNNEFGTYIDTYTIEQAVRDGATVQILYEGREARTKVTGDSLDRLFDAYFGDRTDEERAAIKRKYGTEKSVLEAPQRIRWICIDIIKHYREHIQPNGFKAMIVTNSRHAAVTYKEMLDELEGPESAVIISGDHNDPAYLARYTNSQEQKKAVEKFKKPLEEYGLSILVVKDMLLTGFDAPVCQVMYLDRKLTDHTLLQAIARVNRTSDGKFSGYIVDYYGLSDYLTEALKMFSTEDVAGALNDLKEEIPKLKACHTRVMEHFKGQDKNDMDACILSLEDETRRQQFEIDFRKFAKQMDIVLPDPAANPFLRDLTFLGKVAHGARNMFRDEQLSIAGVGEKVRKLIDEHIYATGVDPKIPPIPLLAQDFEKQVAAHTSPRAKASDIEHAIRHHINVNIEEDPEYYKSLSERLKQIIQQYEDKWEEMVQLLMIFRNDIEEGRERGAAEVGLSKTKYAFYNILSAEVGRAHEVRELDEPVHQEIIEVTERLVDMMEQATSIVDFFQKQDEIRAIKRDIKRTLVDTSFDSAELRQKVVDQVHGTSKGEVRVNLTVGNKQEVPIKVIRTDRRKTATIKIVEGDVHVIVPHKLSQKRIEELINQKANWIRQKLHLQASIQPVRPKEYVSGEAFSYLGKNYRLKLSEGNAEGVKLKGGRFMLEVKNSLSGEARSQYVQAQLAQWYRDHAEVRLRDKAERYAPPLGVSPNSINVKYFKARWGSCSIHGDITFNWRVIMAPHRVVDYVVVHELAHLKHHDHSPRFWKSVESAIPEYRECREWLKVSGLSLKI